MKFHIETERLILRDLRETDLEGMFELDSNKEVHKYLGNKPIKTREEALKNIYNIIEQYHKNKIGRWALINKKTEEFMGWSGLRLYSESEIFNGHSSFYDLGYRIIPKFWGKGFATESGKAALHYAFNTMKLKTVYGITEMGNEASHNALLKIGLNYIEDFYHKPLELKLRWYKIENKLL